jgi:hypothetical protein
VEPGKAAFLQPIKALKKKETGGREAQRNLISNLLKLAGRIPNA